MAKPLNGKTIIVTRPKGQGEKLCQMIADAGGDAFQFPALEITGPAEPAALTQTLGHLGQFDMAIFVSANAVHYTNNLLQQPPPAALTLAAVGTATANAIEQTWQRPVLRPATGFNSEQLLAMPQLQQIKGRKILICRGQGGRELLADVLSHRGAVVQYAEVYRRTKPAGTLAPLQALPHVDLITATSNESLQNLFDMADEAGKAWLLSRALVVISQRTAELAQQLGFKKTPFVAQDAGDEGLVNAILAWNDCRSE